MWYYAISGTIGLVACLIALARYLTKTAKGENFDRVSNKDLNRIRAEYRDLS